MNVEEILRSACVADFWRTLVPALRIDLQSPIAGAIHPHTGTERDRLATSGWARLERVVPSERIEPLLYGLRRLHDSDIPTVFLYVFDEPWSLATMLGPTWTALVGSSPRVLPDVWAWYLVSGRGWKPHRGVNERGTSLVNVWIALTDVGPESACMHVVPFELERVTPARAVPLPVPAGSMLAWNANVLHWGGEMKPNAPPRASLSFTLDPRQNPDKTPSFEERVDLVADMLVTYESSSNVAGPWLEWAKLWRGMREVRSR